MSREQSAIIKGLAILLMLVYHLNNIPGIQGLDNCIADTVITASHPINYFILVSGYGLYCAFRQGRLTWGYLLRRTVKLYLAYWLVLLVFVIGLGSLLYPGRFSLSWDVLFVNFTAWRWDYCIYTWFLFPYVLMSFTSKWVFSLIDWLGNVLSIISSVLLYLFVAAVVSYFIAPLMSQYHVLNHLVVWIQSVLVMVVGAVFARLTLDGRCVTKNELYGKNTLVVIMLLLSFFIRGQVHSMVLNPFHAALVVWLVLHLDFRGLSKRVMVELGNKSMIMWFAQGFLAVVMFSEYYLQLRWPLLIWVVWTIICYIVAWLLMPVVRGLSKCLRL